MVKRLSRTAIQRMIDGQGSGSGSGGSGGAALAGYATQSWVDLNYLSIEFFNRLFTIHGKDSDNNDITVLPNDLDSTIDAIESLFGFWTNFYLAALGTGGDIQLGVTLAALDDVNVEGVENGDALVYDSSTGKWVPGSSTSGTVTEVGMSVPSGLSVSPSRITSSGTFAITFANGYSIPTTAKQANWDTAYTNNHTHSNKSVLDGISSTKVSNWDAAYGWGNHATQGYLKSCTGSFWGQSWSNGGTVTGDMSSVGHVSFSEHSETHFTPKGGYTDPASGVNMDFKFGGSLAATILHAGTGVYSEGYVTALSDIRKKDVKKSFVISLDDLAKMNAIKFVWKDKKKSQELQAGAIAQEWQHILPEVVHEQKNGDLTLDYATAALVSAISLAKEVQELKKEIEILQSHNKVTLGQRIRNFIKRLFS